MFNHRGQSFLLKEYVGENRSVQETKIFSVIIVLLELNIREPNSYGFCIKLFLPAL